METRGAKILSALGKKHVLVRALETELGKTLLSDAMERMDSLLVKIIHEDSTDAERAEYRVLKEFNTAMGLKG